MFKEKTKNRRKSGNAALIATIGISAVLIIVAVILISGAVTRASRADTLDNCAREIFVTAQNQLTQISESGGLSEYDSSNSRGYLGSEISNVSGSAASYYCLSYVPGGAADLKDTILKDILPAGSIKSSLRTGGYYIIEYDFAKAKVKSVFYTDSKEGLNEMTLGSEVRGNSSSAQKERRKYVTNSGGDAHVIGYCNCSGTSKANTTLEKPRLLVNNGNKLTVTVTDPNYFRKTKKGVQLDTHIALKVVGADSGKVATLDLTLNEDGTGAADKNENFWTVKTIGTGKDKTLQYTITLDDITSRGCHFADLCANLIPGEDIDVYATCGTSYAFGTSVTSNVGVSNSLFASVTTGQEETDYSATAEIANIRHLENLDSSISNLPRRTGDSGSRYAINSAYQTADINWDNFIKGNNVNIYGYDKDKDGKNIVLASNSYYGISNDAITAFDGKDHKISGLVIMNNGLRAYIKDEAAGNAGLFRRISSSTKVSNLTLEDFHVTAPENGGALAGDVAAANGNGNSTGDVEIFNVLVKGGTVNTSTTKGGNAGGLIGNCNMPGTKVSVDFCGSSAIVRAASGNAGGLIGAIDSQATVESSYAGGHTKSGKYSSVNMNVTADEGDLLTEDTKSNAGGLIGKIKAFDDQVTVSNSDSTCSAKAVNAGGLIGSDVGSNGGHSYSGCYSTGLVRGAHKGTFGGMAKNISLSNVYYLSGISGKTKAIGSSAKITGKAEKAGYYDSSRIARDNSTITHETGTFDKTINGEKYPFVMVNNAGARSTSANYAHYGDWQKPDGLGEELNGKAMFTYREGSRGNYRWKILKGVLTGNKQVSVSSVYNNLDTVNCCGKPVYGLLTENKIETSSFYRAPEKVTISGKTLYFYEVRDVSGSKDKITGPTISLKKGNWTGTFRFSFNRAFAGAIGKAGSWQPGTEDDPYEVRTASQFENVNKYTTSSFWQSCNIKLTKKYNGPVISGDFDGTYTAAKTDGAGGYTIKGLRETVKNEASAGLFESVSGKGTIVGLKLEGRVSLALNQTVGKASSKVNIGGLAGSNKGCIRDSSADISINVNYRSTSNVINAGGLIGSSENFGYLDSCKSEGKLTCKGKGMNHMRIGGLSGACDSAAFQQDASVINNCTAEADVTADCSNGGVNSNNTLCIIGGLTGYLKGGHVSASGAEASISSTSANNYIGGLIGYTGSYEKTVASNDTRIEKCYSRTSIDSSAQGGWTSGFIAHSVYSDKRALTINDSYAVTDFNSKTKGTAILFLGGNNKRNTIDNCYAIELDSHGDIVTSQRTFTAGAVLKSDSYCYTCANKTLVQEGVRSLKAADFADITSFSNWDTGTWQVANQKYPTLSIETANK